MKKLILLGAVAVMAALTGCATSPSNNAAYTQPRTFHYNASPPDSLTTSNPGSLFDPGDTSEDNDL